MSSDSPREALDRVPVAEAARRLGLTPDAVRKRLSRGSLPHDRDQDGLIHVYISSTAGVQDESETEQESVQDSGQDTYINALEDQIRFLRQELERKDAILLRLAERVPELESAERSESKDRSDSEGSGGVTPRPDDREAHSGSHESAEGARPWWRRIFAKRQ